MREAGDIRSFQYLQEHKQRLLLLDPWAVRSIVERQLRWLGVEDRALQELQGGGVQLGMSLAGSLCQEDWSQALVRKG